MTQYLVRSASLKKFKNICQQYTIDFEEILSMVGIKSELLLTNENQLSYLSYAKLLDCASLLSGDKLFGIKLAKMNGLNLLGPINLGFQLQPTLDRAIHFLVKNIHIQAEGLSIEIKRGLRGGVILDISYAFVGELGHDNLRQSSCQYIYNYISLVKKEHLLQQSDRRAMIHLRQPAPRNYNNVPSNIVFSQPFDGVQIPASWMAMPLSIDVFELSSYVNLELVALKALSPTLLDQKVMNIIKQTLVNTETCSIEQVARVLFMSQRTLQNKLKSNGTSYSELLQKVRYDCACTYLKDRTEPITNVAFKLGFTDVSVFSRTFKRWSGMAPNSWRKQLKNQEIQALSSTLSRFSPQIGSL